MAARSKSKARIANDLHGERIGKVRAKRARNVTHRFDIVFDMMG